MNTGINNKEQREVQNDTSTTSIRRRRQSRRRERFVPQPRDVETVDMVHQVKLATRQMIQDLQYGPGGRTSSQRRLNGLCGGSFLDAWPKKRAPNQPTVYYVSSRAAKGLELLRALHPDQSIEPHHLNPHTVEHTLQITSCRVAIILSCRALGYTLLEWLDEDELKRKMPSAGIEPDAFFRIERPTPEGPKKASFFLEVERSGKTEETLERRLQHYGDFYFGGEFERIFEARSLRVLYLIGADYGISPEGWIKKLINLCRKLEVPMVRCAPLQEYLNHKPESLLHARMWRQPEEQGLCSLF